MLTSGRVVAASLGVAIMVLLQSCTGSDSSHHQSLPTSTQGLVVLAGGTTPFSGGSLAGRDRPISPTGALTTGPDGSIYFAVNTVGTDSTHAQLVRLSPNGTLKPIARDLTHYFYSLHVRAGMLWQFGAGKQTAELRQFPLTAPTPAYFDEADSTSFSLVAGTNVHLLDTDGRPLPKQEADSVIDSWDQRGLVFDRENRPELVMADGTVLRITPPAAHADGISSAQPASVRGFGAAMSRLPGHPRVLGTVQGSGASWTAITTTGLVTVPEHGSAGSTPYDPQTTMPRIYSATILPDETILVTPYQPDRVEVIYPNGRTRPATIPISDKCGGGDTRNRLGSPYGIAFRAPDQVTISSWGCNRLYTINQKAFAG